MSSSIPGNDHVRQKLRERLDGGEAIAFVGAGASAGLYPLWGALIAKLANEAVDRGLATTADREFWLKPGTKPQQAVRGVKGKLGGQIYGQILRDIFGPKTGGDGNRFTPIHAALVDLSFKGFITTNYDPGLLEARREIRRDVRGNGGQTWKDADAVARWLTGDIFKEEQLPLLFAHGSHDRSDTIVLGADEYREAYNPGVYRSLFDKIWAQERLIFVGFGFSDAWLEFLADAVISQTANHAAGEPRHLALVGLEEGTEYSAEMRRTFREVYNAEVFFYRVGLGPGGAPDHGELRELLEELVAEKKALGGP
jgi:hypothetical protein